MGPSLMELLMWGVIIGLTILNYFIAKKLNTNHKTLYPDHQDYKWGYFMGVGAMVFGTLYGLIYFFILISVSVGLQEIVILLASFIIPVILGYYICKKSKQAIIWGTIISLNPIIWIINYFYIKNRRGEFFEKEKEI